MRPLCRAAVVALGVAACAAASDIGGIEFFGYGDLDRAAIRESLPLREGSPWLEENREALRNSVKDQVGTDPADMAVTCCDESGNRWIYIGLGREVGPGIGFLDAPHGAIRLSEELLLLYERLEKALIAAVERGGEAIREDVSRGYALTRDPAAQAIELQIRDYALTHDAKIFRALRDSSDARHRAIAAEAAGYAEHSAEQVAALCRAVRDSSADVRNNAIRALRVLASSDVELAAPIPASLFPDLLSSGVWADRNKSVAVLASLTRSRDGRVLAELKQRSLGALIECARWRWIGHSYWPRVILGRLAGIDEDTIARQAADPAFVEFALAKLRTSANP